MKKPHELDSMHYSNVENNKKIIKEKLMENFKYLMRIRKKNDGKVNIIQENKKNEDKSEFSDLLKISISDISIKNKDNINDAQVVSFGHNHKRYILSCLVGLSFNDGKNETSKLEIKALYNEKKLTQFSLTDSNLQNFLSGNKDTQDAVYIFLKDLQKTYGSKPIPINFPINKGKSELYSRFFKKIQQFVTQLDDLKDMKFITTGKKPFSLLQKSPDLFRQTLNHSDEKENPSTQNLSKI